MPTDETTVPTLQLHISDLEQEIADTKKMVNRLLARKGLQPMYADAAVSGDAGNVFAIRSDQFYGMAAATSAMREYFKMRKASNLGPASLNDIYDALLKGGFNFETENEDNRRRGLRNNLSKNSSLFHRLPNGHYGLSEWYEEIKKRAEENGKTKKSKHSKKKGKAKAAKVNGKPVDAKPVADTTLPETAAVADEKTNGEEKTNGKNTVKNALREAILAQKADFTKQDIVNWIEKHYPQLKAQQRKTSIFSMMGNLKGDLKLQTAKAGKGTEPHRFRRGEEVAASN